MSRLPINWRSHKEVVELVKSEKERTAKQLLEQIYEKGKGGMDYIELDREDFETIKSKFVVEVKQK